MSIGDQPDRERTQIINAVHRAGNDWAEAMHAHKMAPPDPGFASRLTALADAAAHEQNAWQHAHAAGLLWRPVPGAERAQPPYELRPGTGRSGPAELWERFDTAAAELNRAITRSDAAAVAAAFGQLSHAARDLADAVAAEDAAPETTTPTRAQGAA